MKSERAVLLLFGTVILALSFAAPASAATTQVYANDSYQTLISQFGAGDYELLRGSEVSFTWDSDMPLTLVIRGPHGVVESYPSATQGSDTIDITSTGEYSMTWTNSGSVDATLVYDYDVDFFAPVEDLLDSILLGVILGAIVVVSVVVLVVFLILREERKQQPAETIGQFQPIMRTSSRCPNCGSSVDRSYEFCARCGTKLR